MKTNTYQSRNPVKPLLGAIAVAAALTGAKAQAAPAPAPQAEPEAPAKGYHETEHIRRYYRTAAYW
jgi:hypothetical protein